MGATASVVTGGRPGACVLQWLIEVFAAAESAGGDPIRVSSARLHVTFGKKQSTTKRSGARKK